MSQQCTCKCADLKANSQESTQLPKYKLQSEDGSIYLVDRRPMRASAVINQYFIDNGYNDRNCHRMVPLAVPFPSSTVELMIRWLDKHQDDVPHEERIPYARFSTWDKQFFKLEPASLFSLLNASHHLGIEDLMNMGCCAAAELIRGKNTAEIRKIYGIKSDEQQMEEAIANGEPCSSGVTEPEVKKDKKKKKPKKK